MTCFTDASLDWETLEQYFLWQLISAHNIPVEHIMPILPKLDFTRKLFQGVFLHPPFFGDTLTADDIL